jgi:LuxR family transcriptional regulator, maltose regulon positive regulatory protein
LPKKSSPECARTCHEVLMKTTLLATKFHRPAFNSARVVSRPRLVERFNEGLAAERKLTLVSAPAGFGKTTCVSEWLNDLDLPAAWLSLDKLDDDPARFFAYFVAALQRVEASLGQEIAGVLRSGQLPPLEVVAASLIQDIFELPMRFLLILDDFHVIQDPDILQVLERLLFNQPPQLHLVLITREDPQLPLARTRANGEMTEIRAADLRFAGQEPARFLNEMMGLSLNKEDLNFLETRTEGWIVGLQLAGLSMRGHSDPSAFIASLSGSHRFILGYLTEEVLNRQPSEIQTFLLQTSILDKLNGELCDAVTRRSNSQAMLERLLNGNLFLIPLDDDQTWYRYHHLFADLLRSQQNRLAGQQVEELHRRASLWYEQAGMRAEAVDHALAASDYARAVALLESFAMPILQHGYVKGADRWLKAIPAEWHAQSPRTNLAFAWMHLLRGSYHELEPYLSQVEAYFTSAQTRPTDDSPDNHPLAELEAEYYALQANRLQVQGRPKEAIEMAQRSLQMAGPEQYFVSSFAYLGLGGGYRQAGDLASALQAYEKGLQASRQAGTYVSEMLAASVVTLISIQSGRLRYAAEVCQLALERYQRLEEDSGTIVPTAGGVFGSLGEVHYEWNQLDKARQYIERGLQISTLGSHTGTIIFLKLYLARLAQAEGSLEAAQQLVQEAKVLLERGAPAWLRPEVTYRQVRLLLAQNNAPAAQALLQQVGVDFRRPPAHPFELLYLAQLRLLVQRRQPEGLELARQLEAVASALGKTGLKLKVLLLRALLHEALSQPVEALQALFQALALAEPENYQRTFIDEGPALADLLVRGLPETEHPEYVRRILEAFILVPAGAEKLKPEPESPKLASTAGQTPEDLIEPLTLRELEVLRLIETGLKYDDIATELFVSLNTVRFHVKSIYAKLNVDNRSKAVIVARQLGLL